MVRSRRMRTNNNVGRRRNMRSRRTNRRRANGRKTVVTVSNRRPRAIQRNPNPLNLGAGGISTTFRVVESFIVPLIKDADLNSQVAHTISANIELSYSDILSKFSNLTKHYRQIRILRVVGTMIPSAGTSTRSSLGFSVVPRDYAPNPSSTTIDNIVKWLSEGVVVVKKAYLPSVSTWVPTEPDDWRYSEFDQSGKVTGTDVICNSILAGIGLLSDFLLTAKETDRNTIEVATVTWDVEVQLRGRQLTSFSQGKPHCLAVAKYEGLVTPTKVDAFDISNDIELPGHSEN